MGEFLCTPLNKSTYIWLFKNGLYAKYDGVGYF